jgi:hypothetical protein
MATEEQKFLSVIYPPGSGGNFVYLLETFGDIKGSWFSERFDLHSKTGQVFAKNGWVEHRWMVQTVIPDDEPQHDFIAHHFPNGDIFKLNYWNQHRKIYVRIKPTDLIFCAWLSYHKAQVRPNRFFVEQLKQDMNIDYSWHMPFDKYPKELEFYRFLFNMKSIVPYVQSHSTDLKFDKTYNFCDIWLKPTDNPAFQKYRTPQLGLVKQCLPWVRERLDQFAEFDDNEKYRGFKIYYDLAVQYYGDEFG